MKTKLFQTGLCASIQLLHYYRLEILDFRFALELMQIKTLDIIF